VQKSETTKQGKAVIKYVQKCSLCYNRDMTTCQRLYFTSSSKG
jgi:hypothetical protein